MWVISFIRKHILSLPDGRILTTRDFLTYGRRGAIDQGLSYLVKKGFIRRLARGVFVRDQLENMIFTNAEIAKAKAESFGRRLAIDPNAPLPFLPDHLRALKRLPTKANRKGPATPLHIAEIHDRIREAQATQTVFYIDGRTSKFRIGDQIIHLKQNSPRAMKLNENKAGRHLRTLWRLGKEALTFDAIFEATRTFLRPDREDMRKNVRWIPAWLFANIHVPRCWVPVT